MHMLDPLHTQMEEVMVVQCLFIQPHFPEVGGSQKNLKIIWVILIQDVF